MGSAPARPAAPPCGIHYPWGGARRPCRSGPDGREDAERGARDKGKRERGRRRGATKEGGRRGREGGAGRHEGGKCVAAVTQLLRFRRRGLFCPRERAIALRASLSFRRTLSAKRAFTETSPPLSQLAGDTCHASHCVGPGHKKKQSGCKNTKKFSRLIQSITPVHVVDASFTGRTMYTIET